MFAETEKGLAARLGKSLVLVAERDDGEIIGSVEAFTPAFLDGKAVRFWIARLPLDTYLSALAVAPGCRRSGLACALVESVEERAWSAGEGRGVVAGRRAQYGGRRALPQARLQRRGARPRRHDAVEQRPRRQSLARRRQGAQPARAAEGAPNAGAGRRGGGSDSTGAGAAGALASEGQVRRSWRAFLRSTHTHKGGSELYAMLPLERRVQRASVTLKSYVLTD